MPKRGPSLKTLLKELQRRCDAAASIDAPRRVRLHVAAMRALILAARERLEKEEPAVAEFRQRLANKRHYAARRRREGKEAGKDRTIAEALAEIMAARHGGSVSTAEAVDALLEAGYLAGTKYPANAVNYILRLDRRFTKIGRSRYALAAPAGHRARLPAAADIDYEDEDGSD